MTDVVGASIPARGEKRGQPDHTLRRWSAMGLLLLLFFVALFISASVSAALTNPVTQAAAPRGSRLIACISIQAAESPVCPPPPPGPTYNGIAPDPNLGACGAFTWGNQQTTNDPSCFGFELMVENWTRWLAWIIGAIGILWVLLGFYPALSHAGMPGENRVGSMAGKAIFSRVMTAGIIFYIAWRIGDIARFVEFYIGANTYNGPTGTNPAGLNNTIAPLLGQVAGLIIQCFLLYLAPRVVWHIVEVFYNLAWGERVGLFTFSMQRAQAFSTFFEFLALTVGIIWAPSLLTWLINFLATP